MAGVAYSVVLTPTLVDPDDGTYSYKWVLSKGNTTLTLSDPAAATPTLSATAPVAGVAYLDLTVTDSAGNAVQMHEQTITVGSASVEATQTEAPQMVQSHYNAVPAPTAPAKKTRKTK